MVKRRLHWFQRQIRLSSAPEPLAVAAVEEAGVVPLEAVVGL